MTGVAKRPAASAAGLSAARTRMVERQLTARGITDPRLLNAMAQVPRDAFVPDDLAEFAYADSALPIEAGQTISQPYIVAYMIEAAGVSPADRVLEIGAGSGYAAAVLGRIATRVFSIERHRELADLARGRIEALGYDNVTVQHGDGSLGWPEAAPFDVILVAARDVAIPDALNAQLAPGGRLVIPIGDADVQRLTRITRRRDGALVRDDLGLVRFVPLVRDTPAEARGRSASGQE